MRGSDAYSEFSDQSHKCHDLFSEDELLKDLGLTMGSIPRFRACYLTDEGHIYAYGRCGGDNRPKYEEEIAELEAHPRLLRASDCGFDSTYMDFWFSSNITSSIFLMDYLAKGDPKLPKEAS